MLGAERMLMGRTGRTVFAFGEGPRLGSGPGNPRISAVLEAWPRAGLGAIWCRQVHGDRVRTIDDVAATGKASCAGDGDGLMTGQTDLALVVWTADCVPVLLSCGATVAAIHAGWRGLASGILGKSVRALCETARERGTEPVACVGPAVGPCHYEIDEPVIRALKRASPIDESWLLNGNRADLQRLAAAQLTAAGIQASKLHTVRRCTACETELASYRRDGERAGRQLSMVVREAEPAALS